MTIPPLPRATAGAAVLLSLAAALTAAPAAAPSAYSPVTTITPPGVRVQQLATAAGGRRTAVVMGGLRTADPRDFGLWARLRDDGHLRSAQRLSPESAIGSPVAVGADGTAVAVWTLAPAGGTRRVRYAIAPPGRPFGRAQTLPGDPSAIAGGVAVTARGRALLVARGQLADHAVLASVREPGGRFGTPRAIGTARQDVPSAAVGPDDTLVAAWLDTPLPPQPGVPYTPTPAVVRARALRSSARGFAPTVALATMGYWGFGGAPQATGGPGGLAVAWRQSPVEKRVVPVGPRGAFGAAEALAIPPVGSGPDDLALGLPASGPSYAMWHEVSGVAGDVFRVTASVVKVSARSPGGTFRPPAQLSPAGALAGQPRVAALPDRALGAWAQVIGRSRPSVCLAVLGQGGSPHCATSGVADRDGVQAAAERRRVVVTWITGRDRFGAGEVAMRTYRPS